MKATCPLFALMLLATLTSSGQSAAHGGTSMEETSQSSPENREIPRQIRHLPVASFPELPDTVVIELTRRGCMIPQTWQAHGPENVIHASLEYAGSRDWAVLCSTQGEVFLLVFFASQPGYAQTLARFRERERMQPHGASGEPGFNWGIDPATPAQVHQAQAGMIPRPMLPDHDALADSHIDRNTVYHFYRNGHWILLDTPEE